MSNLTDSKNLIDELLKSQKEQILAELKRSELEKQRIEQQQELLDEQKHFNDLLAQLFDVCSHIRDEIDRAAPFYGRTTRQLLTIETIIEQVCSILLHHTMSSDEKQILENIKKEIKTVKEQQPVVPQIKVIGSVNAERDANIDSNNPVKMYDNNQGTQHPESNEMYGTNFNLFDRSTYE